MYKKKGFKVCLDISADLPIPVYLNRIGAIKFNNFKPDIFATDDTDNKRIIGEIETYDSLPKIHAYKQIEQLIKYASTQTKCNFILGVPYHCTEDAACLCRNISIKHNINKKLIGISGFFDNKLASHSCLK